VPLHQLTLAAANQFTGVDVNTGLLAWVDYSFAGWNDENICPVIVSYAYDNGAGTADLTVVLREPGGAATERIVLFDDTGISNHFRSCYPGLVVPRTATVIWELAFITLNKAADASMTVHWYPKKVPG